MCAKDLSSIVQVNREDQPISVHIGQDIVIRFLDMFTLEYCLKDRILNIDVEPGEGLAVYVSSIRTWNPPYDSEVIIDYERKKIINNVKHALNILSVEYVIC